MRATSSWSVLLLLACLPWGCCQAPETDQAPDKEQAWSDKQEVIHQLREVIRYEDETARQQQADLEALALPVDPIVPVEPPVPAGEGEDQKHRQQTQ
jgi:hypothetical protein